MFVGLDQSLLGGSYVRIFGKFRHGLNLRDLQKNVQTLKSVLISLVMLIFWSWIVIASHQGP